MADEKDVLLEMFKQYMDQSTRYLDQRSSTANITLILAAAIIGLTATEQRPATIGLVGGVFLVAIGVFGVFWSVKYHERVAFYLRRASGYRDKLDKLLPNINLKAIQETADKATEKKWGRIYRTPLWWYWIIPNLIVAALGILMIVLYR
jgi:hypothetical protein